MAETDIMKILQMAGQGGLSAAYALNPYAAAANAVPQLFQLGLGIAQQVKGDKLAHSTVRPYMNMPAAQVEALFNARNMAGGVAPGIDLARQQIAQNHAGTVNGIRSEGGSGAERMQALLGADQNAGNQAIQLGQQQEDWASRMMMNLQNQNMQAAETQQKQFIYNRDEPYRNIMAAAQANRDASNQNIPGALTGLGGTFASALTQDSIPVTDANAANKELGDKDVVPNLFDPSMTGSEANYDFDQIEKDARVKASGLKFDPTLGSDQTYDFSKLSQSELAAPVATRIGGDIEQPSYQERGLKMPAFDFSGDSAANYNFDALQKQYGGAGTPTLYGPVFNNIMKFLKN